MPQMPQNRTTWAEWALPKHSGPETATKYPAGAQWIAYVCGLWAAGYQIWPQRGLKAPFAAKFGMELGVLAVFLGPVCHQMPAA